MPTKLDPRTRRAAAEVGRRMRKARLAAELSQEALATRSGMSRTNYARVEAGLTNVTLDTLLRIARGLGIELTVRFRKPARKPAG